MIVECPACGGRCKVVRSFQAGPGKASQGLRCEDCQSYFSAEIRIVSHAKGRGTGPQAVAQRMRDEPLGALVYSADPAKS